MSFSVRSEDEAIIDPEIVRNYISQHTILLSFQFAIVTVLLHDTVFSIDKEVKYFWSCPGKFVSFIYFANRYIGIFGALSLMPWFSLHANYTTCNFSYWARNIANWMTIVLIDYILMIRVLALYTHSKKVAVTLKTLLVIAALSRLGVMIHGTLYQGMIVVNLTRDTTVCTNERIVTRLEGGIDWAIPLIYSTILMALALHKAKEFWKLSNGFRGLNLVKVLIVDQFLYFLLAVACFTVNIFLLQFSVPNIYLWAILGTIGSPTLLCVLGCRLLIHLKEAGDMGVNEGTSYRLKTMSEIEWA